MLIEMARDQSSYQEDVIYKSKRQDVCCHHPQRKNKNAIVRRTKRENHGLDMYKDTLEVSSIVDRHQKERSAYQMPDERTFAKEICFVCYSKYENKQGCIVLECCVPSMADDRVRTRGMDGFLEHERKYFDHLDDETFVIVMKQNREHTAPLQFNGSHDDVEFQTIDGHDLTAFVKVYRGQDMQELTMFEVDIPASEMQNQQDQSHFSLSETNNEQKILRSIESSPRVDCESISPGQSLGNKSTSDKLFWPGEAKNRKASLMCFSIHDTQKSEVVIECCTSQMAPGRIEQMRRDGYSIHGRVDVMARLGEEFQIIMQKELKYTAEINFTEFYQEVHYQVQINTQYLVFVAIHKGEQHTSRTIDRRDHLMEFQRDNNSDVGVLPWKCEVVRKDAYPMTDKVKNDRTSHKATTSHFERSVKRNISFFAFIKQDSSKAIVVVGCSAFEEVDAQRMGWNRMGFTEINADFGWATDLNVNEGPHLFLLNLVIGKRKIISKLNYKDSVEYNVFVTCNLASGLHIDVRNRNRGYITRFSSVCEASKTTVFTGPMYGNSRTYDVNRMHSFEIALLPSTPIMQIRLNRCMILAWEALNAFLNNDLVSETCCSLYYAATHYYYPDQQTINCMCATLGKGSSLVLQMCDEACSYIRKLSHAVMDVYPSYLAECSDPAAVVFVVTLRYDMDLRQFRNYTLRVRLHWNYSEEGQETAFEKCSLSQEDQTRVSACIRKHGQKLMDEHKYLSIITASSVRRTRSYQRQTKLRRQTCLVLYVHMKGFIPLKEDPFEEEYDGIPVDIRSGEFRLFGNENYPSLPNVQMGCQIYRKNVNAYGTLGGFVDHPHYGLCGFTSAHVLLTPQEFDILKRNPHGVICNSYDSTYGVHQGNDNLQEIARIMKVVYKGKGQHSDVSVGVGVEVALFKIQHRAPVHGLLCCEQEITFNSGEIRDETQLHINDKCYKVGCVTGMTEGRLKFNDSFTHVKTFEFGGKKCAVTLPNQYEIENNGSIFSDNGDSGALVFCEDYQANLVCIGMVEGGTDNGNVAVTPIAAVLDALGVTKLKDFTQSIDVAMKIASLEEKLDTSVQTLEQNLKAEIHSVNENLREEIRTMLGEFLRPSNPQNT
ncbi:uncharacterized protein LOC128240778 [Mya arenaria]|uniref:uncharacterized protein LOC128240778 n=1 Tax=Mya arenaria TaxID=6604 RepID=UPI0022DF71E9|nr:uncharacterized protein LOC128240778 [Mya arenaria]